MFEMTDKQWQTGLDLKLHGARRLTILAWEALKASKGSVVLISGSAALDPKPGFAAVATINAAIIALAKAFAEQGIQDGIQVNSVVPGPVMTSRRRSFMEKWAPAHGMTVEEATKKFPAEAGISRYGTPEEIAELMAFLVSPAAKWFDRHIRSHGRRGNQRYLGQAAISTRSRWTSDIRPDYVGSRLGQGGECDSAEAKHRACRSLFGAACFAAFSVMK